MKWMCLLGVLALIYVPLARSDDAPAAKTPTATAAAPDEREMQSWWDDLEKNDPVSSRALLKFAAHPAESVAYFKERLQPLTITEERVRAAIVDLDSDDENVWKPAFEKLEYFDPRLAIDLSTLMNETVKPVARSRLVEILCGMHEGVFRGRNVQLRKTDDGYNFSDAKASWWAEHRVERLSSGTWENKKSKWARASRAIVLLEQIATPEAVAILREMSTGHPDAEPTKTAKEALENIEAGKK